MKSLELVEIIGSLSACENEKKCDYYKDKDLLELLPLAVKNKIPLLYLENVKSYCENCDELKKAYMQLRKKNEAIFFRVKEIVNLLSGKAINYAIFKTLKPFPFIASDIDLLFLTEDSSQKALEAFLTDGNYKLLDAVFHNSTMLDRETGIKIDFYNDITVSGTIYLDRKKLKKYVTETTIDKIQVPILSLEADLLVTIAHSFYKEQLYTLADFYAITRRLSQLTAEQRDTFVELVKAQHIEYACVLLLMLTQKIHSIVFGTGMDELVEISNKIRLNSVLNTAISKVLSRFGKKKRLPYKYNFTTIALGFADKFFRDKSTRDSLPSQIKLWITPQLLKRFVAQFVIHLVRETY